MLKPAGSLWLNLGDSFSRHAKYGAPPKGLLCAPERLLLALAEDGWIVRNKVIWAKPNPLPTSITDRLTLTYEVVYLLVRSPRYFFDLDAIREPHRSHTGRKAGARLPSVPTGLGHWLANKTACDGHVQPISLVMSWGRIREMSGRSQPEASGVHTSRRSRQS